jgi:signal transduction histidine kinase
VPRIDSFVPTILAIIFVADLITAVLLFSQSAVIASRAILILANGYLFSALIVIPHALTFPDAFAPKGLLGAGAQSSAWLNVFWHLGFLVAVVGYAFLKGGKRSSAAITTSAVPAFLRSLVIQISLVCTLTWVVTAGERFMPQLFLDDLSYAPLVHYVAGMLVLISMLVLLLMWRRRTSALDLWIMVAICMLISEMALVTFGVTARFYLGWYISRTLAVAVSTVVLIALLSESMRVHAALVRANVMLERERDNKLMNLEAVTASIAHEVKQPLAAIVLLGAAGLRWLERTPPNHDEVRAALNRITIEGRRTVDIFDGIRTLFRKGDQGRQRIDVNGLVSTVLRSLGDDLKDHNIEIRRELAELPLLNGHKGQLHEVILNLVQNAIEAMATTKDRSRVLRVTTGLRDRNAIAVTVEDSGPGIDPKQLDDIFGAFITTKLQGMGLGLAICRMIIEHHGGELTASSDGKNGASFQFVLPILDEPSISAAKPSGA